MVDSAVQVRTIHCTGTPFEIGESHGRQTADLIAEGIDRWKAGIARHVPDVDSYVRDLVQTTGFAAALERHAPDLLTEIRGIASGADQPFDHILAYNLLDEEWSFRTGSLRANAPGCTAIAIKGSAIGQTMDIPTVHDGTQVVLNITDGRDPESLVFTAAGMLGLNGANKAGVGVVVNNLAQLPTSANGLPVVAVLRSILKHESAAAAAVWAESVPHAVGQHYLIADSTETISIEGAANGVFRVPVNDTYVHTNHPLANPASSADAATLEARSNTHARFNQARTLSAKSKDQGDLEMALADREAPISCARSDGFMTFGGTSIGLTEPPTVRVAPGPPHETAWSDIPWTSA